MHCIDASSLIDAWMDHYTIGKFPSVWQDFEDLINNGELIAPTEVKTEVAGEDNDLTRWLRTHDEIFVDLNQQEQARLTQILGQFSNLVSPEAVTVAQADPYVIALAACRNATVITEEQLSGDRGLRTNPYAAKKIPDVCNALHVGHMNIRQFVNSRPGRL